MKMKKRTGVRVSGVREGCKKKKVLLPARRLRLLRIGVLLRMRLLLLVAAMSTMVVLVLVLITLIAVTARVAAALISSSSSSAIAVVLWETYRVEASKHSQYKVC